MLRFCSREISVFSEFFLCILTTNRFLGLFIGDFSPASFTRLKNSVEKHNKSELIVVPASFFHFTLNLLEIERNESDSYIFHDSISFSSLH